MLTATNCCVTLFLVSNILLLKGGEKMVITDELRNDLLVNRKMLTIKTISQQSQVNRWTLVDVLTGKQNNVNKLTYDRLISWLNKEEQNNGSKNASATRI